MWLVVSVTSSILNRFLSHLQTLYQWHTRDQRARIAQQYGSANDFLEPTTENTVSDPEHDPDFSVIPKSYSVSGEMNPGGLTFLRLGAQPDNE